MNSWHHIDVKGLAPTEKERIFQMVDIFGPKVQVVRAPDKADKDAKWTLRYKDHTVNAVEAVRQGIHIIHVRPAVASVLASVVRTAEEESFGHDPWCNCEDCFYARGGEICGTCGSLNCTHGEEKKEAAGLKNLLLPALMLGLPSTVSPESRPNTPSAEHRTYTEDHLERLIKAIGRAEGAKPELNNPGNIKDVNTHKIKKFPTFAEGMVALKKTLLNIAEGRHHKIKPDMKLREAGLIYSNGDPNWAHNVAKIMHVSLDIPVGDLILGKVNKTSSLQ
jgi:hypothetical protein